MQERKDTPAAALWCAAHAGNEEIVRRLIAEGVDVNVWDRYGRNALTFACQKGNLAVVKVLISAGAWVDPFEDYDGYMTPLMTAAQSVMSTSSNIYWIKAPIPQDTEAIHPLQQNTTLELTVRRNSFSRLY